MATIGIFTRDDQGQYNGEIRTLTLKTRVIIVPAEKDKDEQPDYRVFGPGRVELGAGWSRESNGGLPYISIAMDDPSFAAPLYAALMPTEAEPDRFNLVWSRPRPANR